MNRGKSSGFQIDNIYVFIPLIKEKLHWCEAAPPKSEVLLLGSPQDVCLLCFTVV